MFPVHVESEEPKRSPKDKTENGRNAPHLYELMSFGGRLPVLQQRTLLFGNNYLIPKLNNARTSNYSRTLLRSEWLLQLIAKTKTTTITKGVSHSTKSCQSRQVVIIRGINNQFLIFIIEVQISQAVRKRLTEFVEALTVNKVTGSLHKTKATPRVLSCKQQITILLEVMGFPCILSHYSCFLC